MLRKVGVADAQVSESIMKDLRQKNLAEDVNKKPDFQQVLARLDTIVVREGKLIITPKKTK